MVSTPAQRRQRRLNKAMADGRSFKQRSTRVQSSAVPCEDECDAVEAVEPCEAVDAMKPCTTVAIPEVSYAEAIAKLNQRLEGPLEVWERDNLKHEIYVLAIREDIRPKPRPKLSPEQAA